MVETPQTKNKVEYTLHLTTACYSDEVFDIYCKYELAVHGKVRDRAFFERHLCNSPLYDPTDETIANLAAPNLYSSIDETYGRSHKDIGTEIEKEGSYFMEHRLDGKLVALGQLDFLKT